MPLSAPQSRSSPLHGGLVVETVDADGADRHAEAWRDLASRSLEPNPFMAPGFCLPAARHLAAAGSVVFALAWTGGAAQPRRLLAVVPFVRPRIGLWPVAGIWFHDLAALGTPLLDREEAEPALLAVLAWIGRHWPGQAVLSMTATGRDGPTAGLLREVARSTERRFVCLDERRRAILHGGVPRRPAGLGALSSRRAKELLRQRRRLSERGTIGYDSAVAPGDIEMALGRFLQLESQGWKGRAGSALASHPARAAFVRDMMERMAARGECRIDSLLLDGRPIAMGIILVAQDRHYFWKTAFAEDHAALSPGVQFVAGLTEVQERHLNIAFTDSCAIPDHPMIDRLWPERVVIADAVLEVVPAGGWRFGWALLLETSRRRLRAWLKEIYLRLRHLRSQP